MLSTSWGRSLLPLEPCIIWERDEATWFWLDTMFSFPTLALESLTVFDFWCFDRRSDLVSVMFFGSRFNL